MKEVSPGLQAIIFYLQQSDTDVPVAYPILDTDSNDMNCNQEEGIGLLPRRLEGASGSKGKMPMFLHKSVLVHDVRVQNPDPVFAEKLL